MIVKPLAEYRLYVEVRDGRKRIFDMKPHLAHGVFCELRRVHCFNQVGILFGAVTWPNEQGIAPETLLVEMVPLESAGSPDAALQRDVPRATKFYLGIDSAVLTSGSDPGFQKASFERPSRTSLAQ